ncbi:MAG: NADH-quinone oxidoreductase subunit F [Gammaproteobacteria bacterium]|nr:NADH-quinone oxidoreductase subunit F [Gammaproteobacteria bacterium]
MVKQQTGGAAVSKQNEQINGSRKPRGDRLRFPKGRRVDSESLEEIESLLGHVPARDGLIESLHRIQDHTGCLRHRHLTALAEFMKLPLAEVFEVATFYSSFRVVEDDQTVPEMVVQICNSWVCAQHGALHLLEALVKNPPGNVKIRAVPCLGHCAGAPAAMVGMNVMDHAAPESVMDAVQRGDTTVTLPGYRRLDAYRREGGYELLRSCREGKVGFNELVQVMETAGLMGLGGAGFPTSKKWQIVRGFEGPRYVVMNADESEPGTFKDRHCFETDPHRVLEGLQIAAWAVEAERAYIYLRDEYPGVRAILETEIQKLDEAGITEILIELRRGAGAYICGEESAMIESVEGKRGMPRHRPPFVAEAGVFGKPTLVQNVETLFWIRDIVEKGPEWFASQGVNGAKGMRHYSVSGRVKEPGVKLAPAGLTARQLIDDYCGGMAAGHTFKGYLPGGASGGILPASMAEIPLDFGKLEEHGCFVGSHAIMVISDQDSIRAVALNLTRFFEEESCGQCTPCRVGTEKAVKIMENPEWDRNLLKDLGDVMADASICGLGQAAANPLRSSYRYFSEEVE